MKLRIENPILQWSCIGTKRLGAMPCAEGDRPGTCKVRDSASVRVDIFIAQGEVPDDNALCLGSCTR